MTRWRGLAVAIVVGCAIAGCGKSDSTQDVGYRGYSLGRAPNGSGGRITPPSSGTSNGTAEAVPAAR